MNRFDFDFRVPACHLSLPGHFPGNPIVPGVLLLDHVLVRLHEATGRHVSCLHQVKFTSGLRPDEQAHALCEVDGERASFRLTSRRNGAVVLLARGSLTLQTEEVPSP
jgi:3-hydroxyacyl-[acyl-carrier-protein] dehydratase